MGDATALCALLTALTLFISFFLIGYSCDTLAPTTMALMYDQNRGILDCSKAFGLTPEDHGRYWTGLGVGFYNYRYPTTAIPFSLEGENLITGYTRDGVAVKVTEAFQIRIKRNAAALCKIAKGFGNDKWQNFVVNYARSASRDAIGTFDVSDLWGKRAYVASTVKRFVKAEVEKGPFELVNLQLLSLDIPDEIQREIENVTVQAQVITQKQINQQGRQVTAITQQLQAQIAAQTTVIAAQGNATSMLLDAGARVQATNYTVTAEAAGYSALKAALGLNNEQLLALVWMDTVLASPSAAMALDVVTPSVVRPT